MIAGYLANRGFKITGTQHYDASAPGYLDAMAEPAAWRHLIAESNCNYIINCIGVLKHAIRDGDSQSIQRAIRVNAMFPHLLADAANMRGVRVIHMSTDAVFAAAGDKFRRENDPLDCTDAYGKSKALGESCAGNVLNIRCSIIGLDSRKHKGILEWMLQHPDGAELNGFRDQYWNGVTTLQFAQLCEAIFIRGAFDAFRSVSPAHHFCPNPVTTKYDLLCRWRETTRKDVLIRSVDAGDYGASRLLSTEYGSVVSLYPNRTDWSEILTELTTYLI